ncbi:MAG: hypothetical protein ABIN69_03225 [Aestuariivirga sp.]
MDVEFQVMYVADIIFTMPLKIEHESQLPEYAMLALNACREDLADISMLDEDIVMLSRKVEPHSSRLTS